MPSDDGGGGGGGAGQEGGEEDVELHFLIFLLLEFTGCCLRLKIGRRNEKRKSGFLIFFFCLIKKFTEGEGGVHIKEAKTPGGDREGSGIFDFFAKCEKRVSIKYLPLSDTKYEEKKIGKKKKIRA